MSRVPENVAFLKLGHVALALGVCPSTARNLFDRGELSGIRASDGERLVARESLDAALAARAAARRGRRP